MVLPLGNISSDEVQSSAWKTDWEKGRGIYPMDGARENLTGVLSWSCHDMPDVLKCLSGPRK